MAAIAGKGVVCIKRKSSGTSLERILVNYLCYVRWGKEGYVGQKSSCIYGVRRGPNFILNVEFLTRTIVGKNKSRMWLGSELPHWNAEVNTS